MNCIILDCGHQHILHSYVDSKEFKCPTRIKTTLPCGHETTQKPCHVDVKGWNCSFPCKARIDPCGHSCIRTCHVDHDPDHTEYKCYKTCGRVLPDCSIETHKCRMFCHQICAPCQVIVAKKLPNCNHIQDLECSASGNNIVCMEPCTKKVAQCDHDCKRKCHEPCGGCKEMVMKTLPSCGHEVRTACSKPPTIQNCHERCSKRLSCGHRCKNKCNEVCTELCRILVNHPEPTSCGHKFKIPCYLHKQQLPNYSITILRFCKEPCSAVLECSHKCSGTCGECAQGRIHVTCMEKSRVSLICGHECKIPCREKNQFCKLKCGMKCSHNECTKTCGEMCTKCQESCTRRCIHAECTAACGDICTVSPCEKPCRKKLPCSHPCVGYCGDPCPPLCRICNADELTELLLGYEDEIDARFILLDECKHVIESKGMKIYWDQGEVGHKGIKYRRCPKCRTPITSTQRYSDYIKQVIKDLAVIKSNSNGSYTEIQAKRTELQEKLHAIKVLQQAKIFLTSESINEFVNKCSTLLQPIIRNKRQMFNLMIGDTLEAKLTIAQNIGNILKSQKLNMLRGSMTIFSANFVFSEASTYVDYLFQRLTKEFDQITNQEIQDFKREQNRLLRIAQFVKIAGRTPSRDYREMRELIYQPLIFTGDYDKIVKAKLEEFLKEMPLVGELPDQERPEIVCAAGWRKKQWYKCPNGHIYAITQSGDGMQVRRSCECGVKIGGSYYNTYQVLPNNSQGGKMNGSRHPAWLSTGDTGRGLYRCRIGSGDG